MKLLFYQNTIVYILVNDFEYGNLYKQDEIFLFLIDLKSIIIRIYRW